MDKHQNGINVLLIEDDDRVAAAQELVLRRHGIHVTRAGTAGQALRRLGLHHVPGDGRARGRSPGRGPDGFDVIVLDLGLPDIDGLALCQDLRRITDTPIIISSARGDLTTRLRGLHIGADDYLIKPYDLRELIARMHVVTRRSRASSHTWSPADDEAPEPSASVPGAPAVPAVRAAGLVRVGPVTIAHAARIVYINGAPVAMTAKEFDLLALLATAPGVVFSRDQITAVLWGRRTASIDHNLDVLIARLRRATGQPNLIGTVRNIGYHLGPRTIHALAPPPSPGH